MATDPVGLRGKKPAERKSAPAITTGPKKDTRTQGAAQGRLAAPPIVKATSRQAVLRTDDVSRAVASKQGRTSVPPLQSGVLSAQRPQQTNKGGGGGGGGGGGAGGVVSKSSPLGNGSSTGTPNAVSSVETKDDRKQVEVRQYLDKGTVKSGVVPRRTAVLTNVEVGQRTPERRYADVRWQSSDPIRPSVSALFVPNVVVSCGIGQTGWGSTGVGSNFGRTCNITAQPLEGFISNIYPLANSRQTVRGNAVAVKVANPSGDYFVNGKHETNPADRRIAVTNLGTSTATQSNNFGENFVNLPYMFVRPDTVTVGHRDITHRFEARSSVFESNSKGPLGRTTAQAAGLYSWIQANPLKVSLGIDPLSGYGEIGGQAEVGAKLTGVGRSFGPNTTNWHIVGGKLTEGDSAVGQNKWAEQFADSGLTLRSESVVPEVGERTAGVYLQVDAKAGAKPGQDRVDASQVYKALQGASQKPGYGELGALSESKFLELNRGLLKDGKYFQRDAWVNTGTRVAVNYGDDKDEGKGLAVPEQYLDGAKKTPDSKVAPVVVSKFSPPAPAKALAQQPKETPVGELDLKTIQGQQWSSAEQALRQLDADQRAYQRAYDDGKNGLQKLVDQGRDVFGHKDDQFANFDARRKELQTLAASYKELETSRSGTAASPKAQQEYAQRKAQLDQQLQNLNASYKTEYKRVFDAQVNNAQTGKVVWDTARGVTVGIAAAAAVGAITVGTGGLGLVVGLAVGAAAGSAWDAGTKALAKVDGRGNRDKASHFTADLDVNHSLGAGIAGTMMGEQVDWGKAATGSLKDGVDGALSAAHVKVGRFVDGKVADAAFKQFGTLAGWRAGGVRAAAGAATDFTLSVGRDAIKAGSDAVIDSASLLTDPDNKPSTNVGNFWNSVVQRGSGIGERVRDNLGSNAFSSLSGGFARGVNIRRSEELDFALQTTVSAAVDMGYEAAFTKDGLTGQDAARVLTGSVGSAVQDISSRHVAETFKTHEVTKHVVKEKNGKVWVERQRVHEPAYIDLQHRQHYADKYGVPVDRLHFVVTARHGQSATNNIHATAGNVMMAEARYLGTEGPRVAERVETMYKAVDGKLKEKFGARKEHREGSPADIPRPEQFDIPIVYKASSRGEVDYNMLDVYPDAAFLERLNQDPELKDTVDAAVREKYGDIWADGLFHGSETKDNHAAEWTDGQNPLTNKGRSQAVKGADAIEAVLGFLHGPVQASYSPVKRAADTFGLLTDPAFEHNEQINTRRKAGEINTTADPGLRERGQGPLVLSPKPGVEHGTAGHRFWGTLKNPGPWAKNWFSGVRDAMSENLANNMKAPPNWGFGKNHRIVEVEVDGQTHRFRVSATDETGYESVNAFNWRVKRDAYDERTQGGFIAEGARRLVNTVLRTPEHLSPAERPQSSTATATSSPDDTSILGTLRRKKGHVLSVSHQYTIAAINREITASRWNPLFRQSIPDVGANVVNGKPHVMVVYMDDSGTPRVLEAGYLSDAWAAKQLAEQGSAEHKVESLRLSGNRQALADERRDLIRSIVQSQPHDLDGIENYRALERVIAAEKSLGVTPPRDWLDWLHRDQVSRFGADSLEVKLFDAVTSMPNVEKFKGRRLSADQKQKMTDQYTQSKQAMATLREVNNDAHEQLLRGNLDDMTTRRLMAVRDSTAELLMRYGNADKDPSDLQKQLAAEREAGLRSSAS